jgi:hypothetical protein
LEHNGLRSTKKRKLFLLFVFSRMCVCVFIHHNEHIIRFPQQQKIRKKQRFSPFRILFSTLPRSRLDIKWKTTPHNSGTFMWWKTCSIVMPLSHQKITQLILVSRKRKIIHCTLYGAKVHVLCTGMKFSKCFAIC